MTSDRTTLTLRPVSRPAGGEHVRPLDLGPAGGTIVVGRISGSDWTVPDMTVSRRHASIEQVGGEWLVTDLGSRHGTWLNGQQLGEGERLPLRVGDEVRFGRWACRCDSATGVTTRLTSRAEQESGRVKAIPHGNLGGVAQQRLDALLAAGRELETATAREGVAETLVRCACAGTGCARVLVVRAAGSDAFDVLATTETIDSPRLSRSLIDAAAEGGIVQLTGDMGGFQAAQSMIDLEIRSAICAPLLIAGEADTFLYLDTRGSEGVLAKDAAAFCSALAQLGAMATERLLAAELRARREQLERDLASARRAQQFLMPARSGVTPGLAYCFESIPGRFVAGDLFDLIPLPDGRTAFFLGDVSGKGVGAGLLMAAAQTHLRTLLTRLVGLAESVGSLNEHVHARSDEGTFLTLIGGVFDPEAGAIELVDAGHGFCCRCDRGQGAQRVVLRGGLPIGVAPGQSYTTETVPLAPGARLVLFSDGVVEQPDPAGRQFGFPGALGVLEAGAEPMADVTAILDAVRAFANGPFADDITVVSIAATGGAGRRGG